MATKKEIQRKAINALVVRFPLLELGTGKHFPHFGPRLISLLLSIDFEEQPLCMRLLHIPTLDANHFLRPPFLFNFDWFPDLFGYKTLHQPC